MAQILVVTETPEETASKVVYSERIALTDFDSAHFSGQLVERVGWAVDDADRLEQSEERKLATRRPKLLSQGSPVPASESDRESARSRAG